MKRVEFYAILIVCAIIFIAINTTIEDKTEDIRASLEEARKAATTHTHPELHTHWWIK